MGWWQRNITEPGKLPLLLCFASLIVTFIATRTITRLIRAGRGPFKNNVAASGLHIHHAVPGLILLTLAAIAAIASTGAARDIAAVAIGIGLSLVLDEFALILHLDDVYWSAEGRVSVEVVSLTVACMALVLSGASPFGVNDVEDGELGVRIGAVSAFVVNVALVVANVLKGKTRLALIGAFLPAVALAGAVRLARPASRWAHDYDDDKLARATERAQRFDARWDPIAARLGDLVAGRPSV